jgi:hypothetical protein
MSTRTGSETSVADVEHITTISSLVKSNITQESVTKATHIPKSNHHVKNTSTTLSQVTDKLSIT